MREKYHAVAVNPFRADTRPSGDVARTTASPVPMSALSAQLFRLAKSARGADADALEIYKLSASQVD